MEYYNTNEVISMLKSSRLITTPHYSRLRFNFVAVCNTWTYFYISAHKTFFQTEMVTNFKN